MRLMTFSKRCVKEILRDPLSIFFGLGFPIVLLLMLTAIQSGIPVDLFVIDRLAPGIAVFGLSFMTLFSATLVAKDRESAFLQRLYTTPLRPWEFILGYMLPIIPLSLGQGAICYLAALTLGLTPSFNILLALVALVPISVTYVSLGLFVGSLVSVKAVGGITGGLFTNLSAWLSGVWFDLSLIGGAFEGAARLLPFVHAVELERAIISGSAEGVGLNLAVIFLYATVSCACAVMAFLGQMKKQ